MLPVIQSSETLYVGFREPGTDPDRCTSDMHMESHQLAFVVVEEVDWDAFAEWCRDQGVQPSRHPDVVGFYRIQVD